MSGPVMTMSATPVANNRHARGPSHFRSSPAPTARAYTPRRRNALIPLPLLPAPPPHAIIKSVTVVRPSNTNTNNFNGNNGNTRGRRRSSASSKGTSCPVHDNPNNSGVFNVPVASVPFPKTVSPTSPTAPHSLPARTKGGPRRRSVGVSNGPLVAGRPAPPPPRLLTANPTFVVTVRIPPPPKYIPPPQPAALSSPLVQKQVSPPTGIRPVPSFRRPYPEAMAPPTKPEFHQPRVASAIAACPVVTPENVDDDLMVVDQMASIPQSLYGTPLHPRAVPRPRSKLNVPGAKGKSGSLVMRKCAILNASGPEKGRRIWCLGVKLAQEIWEAEECLKAQELSEADHDMEDAHVADSVMVSTTTTETWSDIVPVEEL